MHLGTNKLSPTFFIGLGGSGGRVVDVLARRLAADPAFERFTDLIHFVALDTDQNDLARLHPRIHKSNLSTADKPRRIALHRGEAAGLPEDRRVTSWVHPGYRFREQSNAGAGQIRLEARYSLHCQIAEQQPRNFSEIIKKQLHRALRAQSPNRGSERVRFHLYASTAGGTGSGASLVVAALLRKLAREYGVEAEVFGSFFLPSLFRDKVQTPLVAKIDANGYAALTEIERFQELRYEGGPDPIELVFDPLASFDKEVGAGDVVERAPFDWVYLVDRPEAMSIEEIYAAAGEAAYLQLFTPILGYQEREADNFRQLQTRLAAGYFALQNGAIGASVIELPRQRLVRYLARRATIEALERFVIARGDAPAMDGTAADTAIDLADPTWKSLSEAEKGRRLDRAFTAFVGEQARAEEVADQPGIFREIVRFESLGQHLVRALEAALRVELEAAEDLVQIDSVNGAAITPENTTLNAQRDAMLRDTQAARAALAERASAFERDLASGRFLGRFFDKHQVSPLLQRYLLIEIDRRGREDHRVGDDAEGLVPWCFAPFEDPEAGQHLARTPADPSTWKLDQPEPRRQLATFEGGLAEASRKLFRREQAFTERRQAVLGWFNQMRDAAQEALVVDFWQRIGRALAHQVQERLEVFRAMAKDGLALVSHLAAEGERARLRGLELGEIGAAADADTPGDFHLGSEVFHDERAGIRAWDEVWSLVVGPRLEVGTAEVLAAIQGPLERRAQGQRDDQASTLVEVGRELDALYRKKIGHHLEAVDPLTLGSGLVLEAQLAATRHRARHRTDLAQVPAQAVRDYLVEKLGRVQAMSRPLGRFDEPVLAGREFSPYRPRFCGVSSDELRTTPLLGDALGVAAGGFERLEDWGSRDLLSFYQACLGVPLYAWLEVAGPLARAYEHEAADPNRREPLHIDARWERAERKLERADRPAPRDSGLPGLDPVRRRTWEDARSARRALGENAVALALAAGVVARDGSRFAWSLRGKSGDLGTSALELPARYASLAVALRGPLDEHVGERLAAEPGLVPAMAATLAGWRFDAEAEGRSSEADALAALIAHLAAQERRAA